jgi:hypothetical protein
MSRRSKFSERPQQSPLAELHEMHADTQPATPFPVHCLPPPFRAMAQAISDTERTPLSLAGCCVLGILSGSIGAGLKVQSGPDRFTRGNLFLLVSAQSGSGKSESFRHAALPFAELESEKLKEWEEAVLPGCQAEKALLESEIKKMISRAGSEDNPLERENLKSQLEQKKAQLAKVERLIIPPSLSVEDVTTEKLAVLLSANGQQLMSKSPDAGAVVNNLCGRYNKADRTDEGIYLKAFSGDYCKVDRIGREPVLLTAPCLTALWLTQPDKIETLLGERSLTDGGLIPRFLICHTNAKPLRIEAGAPGIARETREAYRAAVRRLMQTYRLANGARIISPSPESLAALNAYYNCIVERQCGDLSDVSTFAARWGEQAWRIAVCLHAGQWGAQSHEQTMELQTAQDAIELVEWFAEQQLEILSKGRAKAAKDLRDQVLALLADHPKGIRRTDVYRHRITANAEEARQLLEAMEKEGILCGQNEQPEGGGHVTRIYTRAS